MLRASARDLRSRLSAVSAQVESCAWSSQSGDLLRARVLSVVAELGRSAQCLDDAADALDSHARAAEAVVNRLATVGQTISAVMGSPSATP